MKFIFTFGAHVVERAFIDTTTISKYTVEIDKEHAGQLREVPVRVVAYTRHGGKIILTPNTTATVKGDMNRLQRFVVELIKTIASVPDNAIIKCYSDDEKEWDISVNTDACVK